MGPGRAGSMLVAGGYLMNPLPVQPAKIHCPPPRSDILSRERLNSWLEGAAAGRLGLIIAEAGFGKTTLLADWARHTRRLTAWYRLETDDRDWLTFVRHLVASGRELHPGFAPDTFAMLTALESGGPTRKDVIAAIAREMAAFATSSERGLTLILDDYHVVDGFHETEPIVRNLLDRTGPGFSVVIASRSMPTLPIGRLRIRAGVATLSGKDLCFDVAETSSLFRDAYQHPLDEDVASDLCERTEGWAALLTLVNARLEEQVDPRQLVAGIRATHGDVYDFLAEELFAGLPPGLSAFLMRCSVLLEIDAAAAALASGASIEGAAAAIREAERLGLLARSDPQSGYRFHPLVQEFLASRLRSEVGEVAVSELHRAIAANYAAAPWHVRAWHLLRAGDIADCQATVDGALEQILASGEFEQAKRFLGADAGDDRRPAALFLRSKIALVHGDYDQALVFARRAVASSTDLPLHGLCLLNLAAALGMCGIADEAEAISRQALQCDLTESQRYVAKANLALMQASQEGDLRRISDELQSLADAQEEDGLRRYAAISRLNLAGVLLWLGEGDEALRQSARAETMLGGLSAGSVERVAASVTVAVAIAQLGRMHEARSQLSRAGGSGTSLELAEVALETGRLELEFGSTERAALALGAFDPALHSRGHLGLYSLLAGELALQEGAPDRASAHADRLKRDRCADAAGLLRTHLLRTRIALRKGSPEAIGFAEETLRLAIRQNTPRGVNLGRILLAIAANDSLDETVLRAVGSLPFTVTLLAEELAGELHLLSPGTLNEVLAQVRRWPERWRPALRAAITSKSAASLAAAQILAETGSPDDAAWLRSMAASSRSLRPYALAITRRLAEPIFLQDLGVVEVRMGPGRVHRPLRRKVLALFCYLASRPRMAASREQAIEALWPDLSPDAAGNSLHQAIYYMRRVFEPDFKEGLSAAYIQVDGDVVRLNSDLVDSASRVCWRLLDEIRGGNRDAIGRLVAAYVGRFALTFAYDDWAEAYRENLHAAVLAAAEASMIRCRESFDFDTAIQVGHRLLGIDPDADGIELELLRTYKQAGRAAAAAEQYAHYSAYVRRELGADPPSWDEL